MAVQNSSASYRKQVIVDLVVDSPTRNKQNRICLQGPVRSVLDGLALKSCVLQEVGPSGCPVVDPIVTVGAMVIWRGMVKFPLQRGWVWLKRRESNAHSVAVFAEDGLSQLRLPMPEYMAAISFLAISPL
jgi:hypothetical protein